MGGRIYTKQGYTCMEWDDSVSTCNKTVIILEYIQIQFCVNTGMYL